MIDITQYSVEDVYTMLIQTGFTRNPGFSGDFHAEFERCANESYNVYGLFLFLVEPDPYDSLLPLIGIETLINTSLRQVWTDRPLKEVQEYP